MLCLIFFSYIPKTLEKTSLPLILLYFYLKNICIINIWNNKLYKCRHLSWDINTEYLVDEIHSLLTFCVLCPLFSLSHHHLLGVNAVSKEVTGPNAMVKHSLLPDRQMESPPKRPKSAEGKTSANDQVCEVLKGNSQLR